MDLWGILVLTTLLSSADSSHCSSDEVSPCTGGDNKTCIDRGIVCGGEILCKDKTDIKWCKKKERVVEPCPGNYRRCNTTKGLPGQCIFFSEVEDKKYSCSDRSDENPFSLAPPPVDFSLLKNCTDPGGDNGLVCDESQKLCLRISDWCQSDVSHLCPALGNRYSNDPHLCRNKTFWELEEKQCRTPHLRCQGRNAGRCLEYAEWGNVELGCDNGLDMYQDIKTVDSIKSTPKKTEDKTTSWTLQKFPPNSREPILANQCASEGRIQCKVRGVDMCLDSRSRCDSHPQCDVKNPGDMPEDERNCSVDQLKEKMEDDLKKKPEMNYKCQSPFYDPSVVEVFTLATRCDVHVECWGRVDELNCDSMATRLIILGKLCLAAFSSAKSV